MSEYPSQEMKNQLKEDGYLVVENVLSDEECDHLIQTAEDCYQRYSPFYINGSDSKHKLDDKSGEKIVHNLQNKDKAFLSLLDHPKIIPIVAHMLQEGSYENREPFIQVNNAARTPLPHTPSQQLHIDSRFPGTPFALYTQVLFCLDAFTEENGATRVVPGTHRKLEYSENGKTYPDEIQLCSPRGSAVIFDGSVWHGSSANNSDGTRWAAIFSYARWWVKPAFDFNKNMPRSIYEQLSDQQKELLGFKANPPADEFNNVSRHVRDFDVPEDYALPS